MASQELTTRAEELLPHIHKPSQKDRDNDLIFLKPKRSMPEEHRPATGGDYVTNVTRADVGALADALDLQVPTVQQSYNALAEEPDDRLFDSMGYPLWHGNSEVIIDGVGVAPNPRYVGGEWSHDDVRRVDTDGGPVEVLERAGLFETGESPVESVMLGFQEGYASLGVDWSDSEDDSGRLHVYAGSPSNRNERGAAVLAPRTDRGD